MTDMRNHIKDCPNCREAFETLVSNLRAHGIKVILGKDYLDI